jgi:8-oxo-dGTP pyrophosphatase MutT (NUDIX family)
MQDLDGYEPLPDSGVEARASATIIVARDGAAGLEVFMLERHLDSDFAGGAFVFPGGSLEEADADPSLADVIEGWRPLAATMGERDEDLARALIVCAIRETFEEAGVLLARTSEGDPVDLSADGWDELRRAVDAGQMSAAELAKDTGIRYAADQVRFWQRWVTPAYAPKRYDTRFFVAHLPAGQLPLHDDRETTDSTWVRPTDALDRARAGNFQIIFPTRKTLESVAPYARADDLFDAAVDRPNDAILPVVYVKGDQARIKVPGDPTLHNPW